MSRDLTGKRAILTGASGGIGRATALELVKAGAKVVLASRNAEALHHAATVLRDAAEVLWSPGGEVVAIPTDITRPDDRARLVEVAVKTFGGLDLLINNAGIGSWGHFATSTPEIMRQVMEVNFFGPIELTRLAVPHLTKGNQPAVVNVTSMCGRRGMPAWSEYSASKFALVGMAEAWRGEFARFDVDVITIVPGLTNSGFETHWLRADGKLDMKAWKGMPPERVAAGILWAVRKNRREVVLGSEAK